MLGRIKSKAFSALSNRRDSGVVRSLHKFSQFVDRAYRNEGSEFSVNGERRLLERLRGQHFKTALDVGANVGAWSQAALDLWSECTVHAFEVAPETARSFEAKLRVHPRSGSLHIHPIGLSDKSGSMEMYYFPDDPELTCAAPRHEGKVAVPFTAQVTTIAEFCRSENVEQIDFLKIDVEGAEYKVLMGARDMIEAQKISCIQFEYGAFSTESRFLLKDYFEMLGGIYHLGKIYPQYVDFTEYSWEMEDFRFCNYVAVLRARPGLRSVLGKA